MIRTFKYPLKPNRKQAEVLTRWIGTCCDLYNAALEGRKLAYEKAGKTLTLYDQQKELTELVLDRDHNAAINILALGLSAQENIL